jgi:hypothetical protein
MPTAHAQAPARPQKDSAPTASAARAREAEESKNKRKKAAKGRRAEALEEVTLEPSDYPASADTNVDELEDLPAMYGEEQPPLQYAHGGPLVEAPRQMLSLEYSAELVAGEAPHRELRATLEGQRATLVAAFIQHFNRSSGLGLDVGRVAVTFADRADGGVLVSFTLRDVAVSSAGWHDGAWSCSLEGGMAVMLRFMSLRSES